MGKSKRDPGYRCIDGFMESTNENIFMSHVSAQ